MFVDPAQVDNATSSTLPKPKLVLAVAPDSATKLAPSATMMLPSVKSKPEISSSLVLYACTSEPIARPKLVLAFVASEAPVPPSAIAISVPFQVPDVIVPRVVMFVDPAQVDNATSSTLPKPKSVLAAASLAEPKKL